MPADLIVPDDLTLRLFLLGRLAGPEAERVERYLEAHAEAATTLRSLAGEDTFTSALRDQPPAADVDPEVHTAIARLERLLLDQGERTTTRDDAGDSQPDRTEDDEDTEDGLQFLAPAQSPDELGRLGGYRVLRVLGLGGMGMVLEADDPRLGRRVAIKVIRPRAATSPKAVQRFLQEARAAAAVEHDHIVPIWHIGEDNGVPYIVMPFLRGESLDARLKREPALRAADIIRIGIEAAEGLAAAHAKGLVHRDIKPANLWLEAPRGRVKVLDFGLARLTSEAGHLTQSGAIVGTPAFMAPEQGRGQGVDARSDLFSLGAVLYRMATGRTPFRGTDTMSMLTSLATDIPAHPQTYNPELPPHLAELIVRLLAKDPAKRPQSAREVIALLAPPTVEALAESGERRPEFAFDDDATQLDVPRPEPEPARSPKRKRGRAGLLVGLAAAVLLIGGGLGAYKLVFETKDGTLEVVISDKETEARFKNGELRLYVGDQLKYTIKPSERNKKLPPGEYQVRVSDPNGLEVDTPAFEMKKGGQVVVRVSAREPAGVAAGPPKDKPAAGPDAVRRLAERVLKAGGQVLVRLSADDVRQLGPGEPLPDRLLGVNGITLTGVADPEAALSAIADLSRLEFSLDLSNRAVTDATLGRLAALPGAGDFACLVLIGARVTDDGLSHLTRLTTIHRLFLTGTGVSDIGLPELARLARLRSVELKNTKVTAAGIKALGAARPDLRIVWDGGVIEPTAPAGTAPPSPLDALTAANVPAAERFDGQPPELVAVFGSSLHRHWGQGYCLAVSPDGKTLATGGDDRVIRLWDAATLKPLGVLAGHKTAVLNVRFSPDGKRLLSAANHGDDLMFRLWDLDARAQAGGYNAAIDEAPHGGFAFFGRDGKPLAVLHNTNALKGRVVVYDLADKKVEREFGGHHPTLVYPDVSADGTRLATFDGRKVRVWALADGKLLREWADHPGTDPRVRFSPDGKRVAFAVLPAGTEVHDLNVRDVDTGAVVLHRKAVHRGYVLSVAFSPDGARLASGGNSNDYSVTEVATGKEVCRIEPAGGAGEAVWCAGGTRLVSFGCLLWNGGDGVLRAYDATTGKPAIPLPAGPFGPTRSIALAPDGKSVLTLGEDLTARVWGLDPAAPPRTFPVAGAWHGGLLARWLPDGRVFALEAKARLRTPDGKAAFEFPGADPLAGAVAPDGSAVAVGRRDGKVDVWDTAVNPPKLRWSIPAHTANAVTVAFSPDGKRLVTGGDDHLAHVWGLSGKDPVTIHTLGKAGTAHALLNVYRVAWAPDGKSLAVGRGLRVEVWDVAGPTAALRRELLTPNGHYIHAVAYHPQGKWVAAGAVDGRLTLWDPATGTRARVWQLPGRVWDVQFAPDGRHLLTANANGTAYVLRLAEPGGSPPVDLLALVDPKRDAVSGRWKKEDGKLIGGGAATEGAEDVELLEAPYAVPSEYDTTLLVERTSPRDGKGEAHRAFSILLAGAGRTQVVLDYGTRAPVNGFQGIDNRGVDTSPTTRPGDYFGPTGGPVRIDCRVRRDSITVRVDGQDRLQWKGDVSTLKDEPGRLWQAPNKDRLAVGLHYAEYRVHEWTLTPVGPASPDADRRVAEWALAHGGRVQVTVNGVVNNLDRAGTLPPGLFALTGVQLDDQKAFTPPPAAVRDLKALASLRFGQVPVTDDGLEPFTHLTTLRSVDAFRVRLTDRGLQSLARLPNLVFVNVAHNPVTDDGVRHLAGLPKLEHLSLQDTRVTDRGLEVLAKQSRILKGLGLDRTDVSDAGLEHLKGLMSLEFLVLSKTKVTEAGVKKLAAALPACKIDWDGGVIEPKK